MRLENHSGSNDPDAINVTSPFFPPLEEYQAYLTRIWKNKWLTNNGELVIELENELKKLFKAKHVLFLNNGTTALHIAIQSLELEGEILTTPFSYVATSASIAWMKARPVFVDIDPHTLCLDPALLEKHINAKTSAILATHVYGNPCDVQAIEKIANEHGLKVIYDAAHAFGVNYQGACLMNAGDVSVASFHATKTFHTGEGGAIITQSDELAHKVSYIRNAGHKGTEDFWGLGINGKSSELHAAMGLCNLKYVSAIIERKKQASLRYDELLKQAPLSRPRLRENTDYNYAYYPVLFKSEEDLLRVRSALNAEKIYPRRYFYPSLSALPFLNPAETPVTDGVTQRVLCLPLFYDLKNADIERIARIVLKNL